MTAMIFNLGPTELIIILVIVLLLFGGTRLAGLGKSSGRALKEFKEETKGLKGNQDERVDGSVVDDRPTTPEANPPAGPTENVPGATPQAPQNPRSGDV